MANKQAVSGDEHVELVAARLTACCSKIWQGGQLQSNDKVFRGRSLELKKLAIHMSFCDLLLLWVLNAYWAGWMWTSFYIGAYWIRARQLLANQSQDQSSGPSKPIIARLILANQGHSAPYISSFTFTQITVVIEHPSQQQVFTTQQRRREDRNSKFPELLRTLPGIAASLLLLHLMLLAWASNHIQGALSLTKKKKYYSYISYQKKKATSFFGFQCLFGKSLGPLNLVAGSTPLFAGPCAYSVLGP